MSQKCKRLISCFVSGVEIDDKKIVLEDTNRRQYFLFRENASEEALSSFKIWFENVYLKAVAQMCTIIDYDFAENGDGEAVYVINRIVSNIDQKKVI